MFRTSTAAVRALHVSAAVVDDFDALGDRIPLDVKRLAALLAPKIGRRRLKVVIVGLPDERGPAGMAHPKQKSHAVLALPLEHGAITFVIEELGE